VHGIALARERIRDQNRHDDTQWEAKMRMMILAVVALCMPAAAMSDPATVPSAPTVTSAGVRPGQHLICQYMYHDGTIVGRPICRTEQQWIRSRLRQQADVYNFQVKSLSTMGGH
jgi:hypothetical protein